MTKFELKNKNVFKPNYLNTLRQELSEKYLINPFKNTLNNPNDIKILTAPTGFGKTYTIWNIMSPLFFEKYGSLHIHIAPHKETLNEAEIEHYLATSFEGRPYPLIKYSNDKIDWTVVTNALANGRKVILVLTDKKIAEMFKDSSNPTILQITKDYGNKVLITRDEFSYGSTTTPDNYKNTKGHPSDKYLGTYFKNLYTLFKAGAHLYGFTATPTREQLGELPLEFDEEMKIINEWPSKSEMILFQKWWELLQITDYTTRDYSDINILKNEIKFLSDEVTMRERELSLLLEDTPYNDAHPKFTGIMSVQIDSGSDNRFTLKKVIDIVKADNTLINKDYTFIATTAEGWIEYDYKGNKTGSHGTSGEWLSKMNSQSESARLLVVIYKGNYGINIPSLCAGVSLRNPLPKTEDTKETIRAGGIQFIGRLNRTSLTNHSWNLFKELTNEYGDERAWKYLQIKNTFKFRAPDGKNNYWVDSISDFKDKYGTSFAELTTYLY